MSETKCPCCGRGCDLEHPSCARGEEYARTGVIPAHKHEHGPHGHGHFHGHDRQAMHHKHHFESPISEQPEADINSALILRLHRAGHASRLLHEGREGQKRVLMLLAQKGPMTQRELTELLRIQSGSASELFGKLESAGVILRTPNETDLRTADIQLTGAGQAQAAEALERYRTRKQELFTCLSEAEKETLLTLLTRLIEDWETRYPPQPGHGCHKRHADGRGAALEE